MKQRWCIVVRYSDGSAVLGAYGPYETAQAAEDHMKILRSLPDMGLGATWAVESLWEIP